MRELGEKVVMRKARGESKLAMSRRWDEKQLSFARASDTKVELEAALERLTLYKPSSSAT
jgi:hypothetical protein